MEEEIKATRTFAPGNLAAAVAAAVFAGAALAAPLAIAPKDRMAMADRLFDRENYQAAKAEYEALRGEATIQADDLLYRLAECARCLGDKAAARKAYGELLQTAPLSRHAPRARLMRALAGSDDERRAELRLLDSDKIPAPIRATALYHLGVETGEADAFRRCLELDPKGRYAQYAKFRHASILAESKDAATRRKGIAELVEIYHSKVPNLSKEALYSAGMRCYMDKSYREASTLLRTFLKLYANDERSADVRMRAAWSDYLDGKYADAAALCGEGGSDDADYLIAVCACQTGERDEARALLKKYIERHPNGRHRAAVELPLSRMEFEAAGKGGDSSAAIEAAKRSAALSKSPADRLRLAWAYERAKREDEAAAEYAAIASSVAGSPEAAEALFRKALIDVRAERWTAADLALKEMLSIKDAPKEKRAEALYWRGVAAFMAGHDAEGAPLLREAVKSGLSLDQSREARLMLADHDFKEERIAEAKAAYAQLVREGACERMGASKIRSVGYFLLGTEAGTNAYEEAAICGRAIVESSPSPEWYQAGYALEGAAEEAAGRYSQAIVAYRAALAQPVRTEDAADTALALGILESKAGNYDKADAALREAVSLNATDTAKREKAYLWLAKTAKERGEFKEAEGYATLVVTLFDQDEAVREAQKLLDSLQARQKKGAAK